MTNEQIEAYFEFEPNNLKRAGWKGYISNEQREHYLSAYQNLYPGWDDKAMIKRLSLYFAGSLTRHKLEMTGQFELLEDGYNGFIQISFTPPIKGLPEGFNDNWIYYRTLPMSYARTHISPWRAKGYFRITGNLITPKIVSFRDPVVAELMPNTLKFTHEDLEVNIKTDYYIES